MQLFDWDEQKNRKLKAERGVSFDEVVAAINNGDLLDIIEHHNQSRYQGQELWVVRVRGYVYVVPTVSENNINFLKTAYPNRKLNLKYKEK
jgi:uncharacterized DUF497 family protein